MNLIPGSNPPSNVDPLSTRPALSSSLSHLARKSAQVSFDGECFPLRQYVSQFTLYLDCDWESTRFASAKMTFNPVVFRIIHMLHLIPAIPLQWMDRIKTLTGGALPPRPLQQPIQNEAIPQSGDLANIIFRHNPSPGRAIQLNVNIPCTIQAVKLIQERGRITLDTTRGQADYNSSWYIQVRLAWSKRAQSTRLRHCGRKGMFRLEK